MPLRRLRYDWLATTAEIVVGKQTLCDQPNDDGAAETAAVRKKRENRAGKPDVITISFVRDTDFPGHPQYLYCSAKAPPACVHDIRAGNMIVLCTIYCGDGGVGGSTAGQAIHQ